MHQAYIEVFKDSFFANFIITFSEDFAYSFILFFDNYNHVQATILAILGSFCGLLSTFLIFRFLASLFHDALLSSSSYSVVQGLFGKLGFLVFAIIAIPNLSILVPVFSGLVKYNIKSFIFYTILYRSAYYFYVLYG